jgi:hypothetical protein
MQPVLCYTANGEFYKCFRSISEAHKELGVQPIVRTFSDTIMLKNSLTSGYILFKYIDDAPEKIRVIKQEKKPVPVPLPRESHFNSVIQYNREGEFMAEYPSSSAASKASGISLSCIRNTCKRKLPLLARYRG